MPDPEASPRADLDAESILQRALPQDEYSLQQIRRFTEDASRFMLSYEFAVDEVMTKIGILQREFEHLHDYNPIEHYSSRIKSADSIMGKAGRLGLDLTFDNLRENLFDIAGVRITCSFISDTYRVAEMLSSQGDVTLLRTKDYITDPKPNGYKSLHLIVSIPIYLSDSVEHVPVEIQIRTIAMDFWASLEHKIYYRFHEVVPPELLEELVEAAEVADRLDHKMERIHEEVRGRPAREKPRLVGDQQSRD
ncbi:GTP pyrophosphokinase [Propionibacteriaceae bacterium Y1685]|uniref:GTP pyrophosphokinase n=1 Tax=Microlunatus sp. Y1700 TaxID=3418487 RepID=UPI003B7BF68F